MNGKQRAYLRSLANGMGAVFQIGKEGIGDNLRKSIDEYLEAHELVKISIHENAGLSAKQVAAEIVPALCAEPVQCIGRRVVLYRESVSNKRILIP